MTTNAPPALEKERLQDLLQINLDARRYFYHKADERWLEWLWRNGFLDVLKEEDASLDGFRTPEIEYLLRMAEKRPDIVVDIMLATPVSTDMRSQEVAYGFLRICRALSADQLARVVEKIRTERWAPLLDEIYNHSGLAYEEMFSTLADANDSESFLYLVEAALAVRKGEEMGNATHFRDSPFYLDNLNRTRAFEQLAAVNDEYAERALALTTSKLAEIMASSDQFLLLDVDFFTLESGQTDSWQADVRELAAAAKALAVRLIGERCAESGDVRRVYMEHLAPLPDSRVIRRLRLFFLSLCPQAFREELKQAFFSLFAEENYFDEMEGYYFVMSGAEYLKALREGFPVLSSRDKLDYVQRTMATFRQPSDIRYNGSPLLSVILPYLNENPALKERAEKAGYQLDPDYEPRPSINWGDGELKTITSQAPISPEEFRRLAVAEIANRLRQAWTPTELNAQNSEADFYNPLNAEGVGDLLKDDIPGRLREYVENAGLFFERGALDQHYTYAFLMGVREAIKNDRAAASEVDWGGVIGLFADIKDSGTKEPFESGQREPAGWYDSWLANWDAVHSAMAVVLRELLSEQKGQTPVDFGRYRDRMLKTTGYLLACPDPFPAEEQDETSSSGDRDESVTRLHSLAINSMRGRAFEAFVSFVVQDRREFSPDDGIQTSDDVKRLYERVLQKENSRALMFLFGYYLPFFYFGDREWIRKLLPRIFPQERAQEHMYIAAWRGFLTKDFYEKMFFDPAIQTLYRRGLELPDTVDSLRKNRSEPGARLARQLALAFMHFKEFGFEHQLFKAFWEKGYPCQHAHFVKFLGLSFVSGGNSDRLFSDHPESKQRLRDFWDWLLKKDGKPEVYLEFGTWINLDKGIFEPAWLARRVKQTLEEADGILDWDVELVKASPRLAQAAPEDTLAIARLYLLVGGVHGKDQQALWPWDSDNKWLDALEILYRNPVTREETESLINRLVHEGGRAFWPLKRILDEEP